MTHDATFAAGCFWGVESAFREVDGVVATEVGYTGGTSPDPTYKQVCSGRTGHAEAVRVTYDPERVSYEQLLDVFWRKHNPRSRNRQGMDIGSQYRSAIFTHDDEQHATATASKAALEAGASRWRGRIATQVVAAGPWHRAEERHQQYHAKQSRRQPG